MLDKRLVIAAELVAGVLFGVVAGVGTYKPIRDALGHGKVTKREKFLSKDITREELDEQTRNMR